VHQLFVELLEKSRGGIRIDSLRVSPVRRYPLRSAAGGLDAIATVLFRRLAFDVSSAAAEHATAAIPATTASARVRAFGNPAQALLTTGLITLSRRVTCEDRLCSSRTGTSVEAVVRRCIVSANYPLLIRIKRRDLFRRTR
jgi:hypothetical protein